MFSLYKFKNPQNLYTEDLLFCRCFIKEDWRRETRRLLLQPKDFIRAESLRGPTWWEMAQDQTLSRNSKDQCPKSQFLPLKVGTVDGWKTQINLKTMMLNESSYTKTIFFGSHLLKCFWRTWLLAFYRFTCNVHALYTHTCTYIHRVKDSW